MPYSVPGELVERGNCLMVARLQNSMCQLERLSQTRLSFPASTSGTCIGQSREGYDIEAQVLLCERDTWHATDTPLLTLHWIPNMKLNPSVLSGIARAQAASLSPQAIFLTSTESCVQALHLMNAHTYPAMLCATRDSAG